MSQLFILLSGFAGGERVTQIFTVVVVATLPRFFLAYLPGFKCFVNLSSLALLRGNQSVN